MTTRLTPLRSLVAAVVLAAVVLTPGAAVAAPPTVGWSPCTEEELTGFDCATHEVPLDHDRPRGTTTTIAMARRPADDPARRIGTLFMNPGGPGGPGRFLVTVAHRLLSPDVLARFDVVAFDPRGIGASDPVQCFATDEEAIALVSRLRGVPLTATEISETLRANYEYTEACKRNMGPLLPHMSTLNVAKDLDLLRRAVGDDRLTYVGYSYGTMIGATYVNLFPQRVRAVILDGNVDPEQRADHRLANKFDRAGGFELALDGFLRACDAAGPDCAFSGDARRKFDAIRERFRQGPVELPEIGTVTIDDLTSFVGGALYDVLAFPDAAVTLQAIHEVLFGTPAGRAAAVPPVPSSFNSPPARGWLPDAYGFNGRDAYFAVNCLDAPLPRDPARYPAIATAFEAAHRTFGRVEAFGEVGCANWPRTDERYAGPWNRRTAHTVLVVNPTFDPATRYDFAVRMTRQLGDARLLTLDGFGHTSGQSACVTGWYTRYLIDGAVPPAGTRCGQDVAPFPPAG
ncbi:alpha/beta hydrolase [Catenuloplanes atrovinosus]|uniref:Pimeloyl-ACP methyl ester carboxylesterase n=1 Tax=Catenuloplanes atrovinosus TaxID=137266 RepID=A0AAE3YY21_9ACTN|nr:alpha/beta hydrolase [Catenuloplanes atrovinosus]MDR7280518.1 pimeloyl-ACP methyl ester carboxylesterase [Catenuloplanes atrovinosus]